MALSLLKMHTECTQKRVHFRASVCICAHFPSKFSGSDHLCHTAREWTLLLNQNVMNIKQQALGLTFWGMSTPNPSTINDHKPIIK